MTMFTAEEKEMPLTVPEMPSADIYNFATNAVLRAQQAQSTVVSEYLSTYQQLWGVTEPGKGSRHTLAEMQQILDMIGLQNTFEILEEGRRFVAAYGSRLEQPYTSTPWVLQVTATAVTVLSLANAWKPTPPPVEAPVTTPVGPLAATTGPATL